MKTALIDASPKKAGSTSGRIADLMAAKLEGDTVRLELHEPTVPVHEWEQLASCDNWVFFSPLYVDALPSHLLACLVEIAESPEELAPATVYGVINCGFLEGIQSRYALEVLRNWADAIGLKSGGGLGIGGGGAVHSLPAADKGPLAQVLHELDLLAARVEGRAPAAEPAYTAVKMPRFLYRAAGELSWRHEIRQNGGKPRDLGRRREPV